MSGWPFGLAADLWSAWGLTPLFVLPEGGRGAQPRRSRHTPQALSLPAPTANAPVGRGQPRPTGLCFLPVETDRFFEKLCELLGGFVVYVAPREIVDLVEDVIEI